MTERRREMLSNKSLGNNSGEAAEIQRYDFENIGPICAVCGMNTTYYGWRYNESKETVHGTLRNCIDALKNKITELESEKVRDEFAAACPRRG